MMIKDGYFSTDTLLASAAAALYAQGIGPDKMLLLTMLAPERGSDTLPMGDGMTLDEIAFAFGLATGQSCDPKQLGPLISDLENDLWIFQAEQDGKWYVTFTGLDKVIGAHFAIEEHLALQSASKGD